MNPDNPAPPGGAEAEIFALIETLHQAGQRLEQLTAGEVDTVADRHGSAFMLQSAQTHMRHNEAAKQTAILNALPAHIALLDAQGRIILVNEAWQRFAGAHVLQGPEYGVGINYLEICDSARGSDAAEAHQVGAGIRSVLAGAVKRFSVEYPSHSAQRQRWFLLTVSPLAASPPNGVVVMHQDITERKSVEVDLRWKTAFFESLVNTSADGITVVDAKGRKILQNRRTRELWKIPEDIARDPDDRRQVQFVMNQVVDAQQFGDKIRHLYAHPEETSQDEVVLKDGTILERYSAPVLDGDGHSYGRIWSFRDITERHAAQRTITRLNRVHAMLSGINTLIVREKDRDPLFREACQIAVVKGGFRMALIGLLDRNSMKMSLVASAGMDDKFLAALKDLFSLNGCVPQGHTMTGRAIREKKVIVTHDLQNNAKLVLGKQYAEIGVRSMVALPLLVSDEVAGVLVLYASEREFFHEEELSLLTELAGDIAFAIDHIDKQERLNYLAYYDVLTGLANRSLFLERVAQYIRSAASGGHKLALYLIDLERFKNISDSLGRAAGDALLRQVAEWLTHNVGDANLVARLDADHFAAVLPEIQQEGDAARFIENMMEAFLHHPFRLNQAVFSIAAKTGIALFPDDGADADTLFKNAEAALKKAKASGERYLFFTPSMTASVAGKLTLENQLRQALDRGEFVLHYQPKVDLQSGQVTSAEALIRWNDPRTGLVPPGRIIPILEETGLIYEVGRWALRQAIDDYLRWRSAGLAAVRIAVNVSPLQLRNRGFIAEIERKIGIDAHAADGLELEITESLIMEDVKRSIDSLQAIRALGIRIAIDDFGTGFSSLSYLSRLPVDTLKIDRSFVIDMTTRPQGLALVSTIINLAHSLALKVVAEGVETEEQSRLLRLLNCDEMQGYLFSQPLPAELFETRFLTLSQAR